LIHENTDRHALGAGDAGEVGGLAEPVVQQRAGAVERQVEDGATGRHTEWTWPDGAAEQYERPEPRQAADRGAVGATLAQPVGLDRLRQQGDAGIVERRRGGRCRRDVGDRRTAEAHRIGLRDRMSVVRWSRRPCAGTVVRIRQGGEVRFGRTGGLRDEPRERGATLLQSVEAVAHTVRRRAPHQPHAERHTDNDVPPEEPPGLLAEAVQPLQPDLLHPPWRPPHVTAQEAEAVTDPQPPGRRQGGPQQRDQAFLLWGAERHVDDVGAGRGQRIAELAHDALVLLESEGRTVSPRDLQSRIAALEHLGSALGRAGCAAEHKDRSPATGGPFGKG
jgi:hypothetical protein